MTREEAQALWVQRVSSRARRIDPDDSIDWYDMAFGFFLALGFKPREAHEMANVAKGVGT